VQGWTPLHCAAQGGKTDVVEMLLSHGADAQAADAEASNCGILALFWCDAMHIAPMLSGKQTIAMK